jgi:hypothetical protein
MPTTVAPRISERNSKFGGLLLSESEILHPRITLTSDSKKKGTALTTTLVAAKARTRRQIEIQKMLDTAVSAVMRVPVIVPCTCAMLLPLVSY